MDGWVRPLISNTLSLYQRDFQLRWKSKKFLYSRGSGFNAICRCKVCISAYLFLSVQVNLRPIHLRRKKLFYQPMQTDSNWDIFWSSERGPRRNSCFLCEGIFPRQQSGLSVNYIIRVGRTPPYQPIKFPVSRVVNVHWSNSPPALVASSEIGGLKKKKEFCIMSSFHRHKWISCLGWKISQIIL